MPATLPAPVRRAPAPAASASALRIAAIDVGTNSIHMIVAEADPDGGISTLWRMKEMVGLGRVAFPSKTLTKDTIDRAVATLSRFKQAAAQRQCEKIVAVATSAVREAANGGEFLRRVQRALNLDVRIISGREEARLVYLGVRHALPLRGGQHLIIDVGGGSVEFIVGDHRRAVLLESRKLGAARMTAAHVNSDPIKDDDLKSLRQHYERELRPLCEQVLRFKPVKAIGTSGTMQAIYAMCATSPSTNGDGKPQFIDRPVFNEMLERLLKSNSRDREHIPGLDPNRRDQILAGALLVDEIFRRLKLRRIQVCGAALREGILVNYLQRHLPDLAIRQQVPQPRLRSVIALARRCAWHRTHSEQVARLCMKLYDDLESLHGLDSRWRELIEYAALLHDIGWHIGRKSHHKHSMYLIQNGDLKDFTPEEIDVVANIARYHRKTTPKLKHTAYAKLSPSARRAVQVGAALLRVSDGLDRSHSNVVRELKCRTTDKEVKCILTAKWDAQLELWGAGRKSRMFERVLKKPITFELVRR